MKDLEVEGRVFQEGVRKSFEKYTEWKCVQGVRFKFQLPEAQEE
jgi:hypothetical protein